MTTFLLASALKSVTEFFLKGGVFMFVLVILSIITLTVVFLRGKVLQMKKVLPPEILDEVDRLVPGESFDPLLRLTEKYPSPLGRLISIIIRHREMGWQREETIEAVQTKARTEVMKLEKGVLILEISTGIAPLLGLLGTLSGLVGVFTNLGPSGDPVGVALGISEALNATIAGLVIAVASLIAFNYFSRKVEIVAVSLESVTTDVVSKCYPRKNDGVAKE